MTSGEKQTIAIPPSLLISAMGQIDDVSLRHDGSQAPGNLLYLVGETYEELGGSHYALVSELTGGHVPEVNPLTAKRTFDAVHAAICQRLVRSCHDLSEGGLAVAAAEMALAGRLGISLDATSVDATEAWPAEKEDLSDVGKLFGESNTRFLLEVHPDHAAKLESIFVNSSVPLRRIGEVQQQPQVQISLDQRLVVDMPLEELLQRWKNPLNW